MRKMLFYGLMLSAAVVLVALQVGCLSTAPDGSGSKDEKGNYRDPSEILPVGTLAPEFSVADDAGNTVSLADLKGKKPFVLIFYPGNETPGCTKQLCSARDDWDRYTAKGVSVFGVNPADSASHAAFRENHKYPFPLLADTDGAMVRAFGCRGALGMTIRTVYGVDKEGRIVFAKRGMPETSEILAAFP